MPPILSDYCESCGHGTCNCPYRDYVDTTHASVENTINEMTDKMVKTIKQIIAEYFHYFNHSREDTNLIELDSSLGSPKSKVSIYDDFESSYLARLNLNMSCICLA